MVLLVLIATGLAAGDDLEQHRFCASCGMDRKAYGYSRMLIRYEDGADRRLQPSLRRGKCPFRPGGQGRLVADRDSRVLIDAAGATWVLGGINGAS